MTYQASNFEAEGSGTEDLSENLEVEFSLNCLLTYTSFK